MKRKSESVDLIDLKVEKENVEKVKKYTGLCVNCDNREDCKIRNDDFVIWHCEEYQ